MENSEYEREIATEGREEVFHCRRQEGMDDWVAVRTEASIEARSQQARAQQATRNQQSEELLDKEIKLIRNIMMKLSERKISVGKRRSSGSSEMKTERDRESATSGARQHKIWRPGEKTQTTVEIDNKLQNKVWDPGGQILQRMIRRS